mmetsp:Transcript_5010/g.9428  ORF Transcript_5010/g.9428 Transcript_5010/m.9428 type:complete len:346 (-) Transcript_5010:3-1040(-)
MATLNSATIVQVSAKTFRFKNRSSFLSIPRVCGRRSLGATLLLRSGVRSASGASRALRVVGEAEAEKNALDRGAMYESTYGGEDSPEWLPARFVRAEQLSPGVRNIVLEIEKSREQVKITNAHTKIGQKAQVKVAGGEVRKLVTASSPEDPDSPENWAILLNLRGDTYAGSTKRVTDPISLKREVEFYVTESEALDVYNLTEDTQVEVGPWVGAGIKLKELQGMFKYRTLLVFSAGGAAAASARALLNAQSKKGLQLDCREAVRLYSWASSEQEISYVTESPRWESQYTNLRVVTGTGDSPSDVLASLFDNDDTLEYNPETCGALILGDSIATEQALKDFFDLRR